MKKNKTNQLGNQLAHAVHSIRRGDWAGGEQACRTILKKNQNHVEALHLFGLICLQKKQLDEAKRQIEKAINLQAENPNYYNTLGTVFMEMGHIDEALKAYSTALNLTPEDAKTNYSLGAACVKAGLFEEAVRYFRKTVAVKPDYIDAYINLSAVHQNLGQYEQALACCRKALDRDLIHASIFNNLGTALKSLGQLEQAAEMYLKSLTLEPASAQKLCNLGNTLCDMGQISKALECYQKALTLDPDHAHSLNGLGTVCAKKGRYQDAAQWYQKAIQLMPDEALFHLNIASLFADQNHFESALKCLNTAIQLNPMIAEAHNGLGIVYKEQGKSLDAQTCFKKAIAIRQDFAQPYCSLIELYQHECNWAAIDHYSPILDRLTRQALENNQIPKEGPFQHLIRHADPEANCQVAKAWSLQIKRNVESNDSFNSPTVRKNVSKKKLTIGYLSNNFKNHPTAHLIAGLFRCHDREKFTVISYSYGNDDHSTYRKRIAADSDQFVDIEPLDYISAARRIHQHGVDILVDLVGFMKGNRLEIPALRPAPVQVRWLGMAGTCGADFFDYLITDEIVTPGDSACHYAETLCYMPHTYQINSSIQDEKLHLVSRSEAGLPENRFVFCSFCTTYKIDALVFNAWMRILAVVPDSVLWLLSPSVSAQTRLKQSAHQFGIDPARLIFAPRMDRVAHLSRLSCADLGLDTLTVNGAATTSEALWCGVPVLTMQGKHFASRMASSILTAVGLPEMVVGAIDEYIKCAVTIAKNRDYFQKLKDKLAENKTSMPLFNTTLFVRNLESNFEWMWRVYQLSLRK